MDVHAELSALDRLLGEVYRHADGPEHSPEMLHALRNLSHLSGLLAEVLSSQSPLRLVDSEDSTRAS